VPKNANRQQFIHHFLVSNGLNPKFQASIIKMVEERVKQEQMNESSPKTDSHHSSHVPEGQAVSRLTGDSKVAERVRDEQHETVSRGIKN